MCSVWSLELKSIGELFANINLCQESGSEPNHDTLVNQYHPLLGRWGMPGGYNGRNCLLIVSHEPRLPHAFSNYFKADES